MSSNRCIIPECYIDTCLVEVLLNADKNHVNHQKGNGTVAREMTKCFIDDFCIGIIDEDKRQLDYLKFFKSVVENDNLRLWQHENKRHYMIQIRPVIERWIMSACEKGQIDLKDFDLPTGLKELMRIAKSVSSGRDPRFVKLFKEMLKRDIEQVVELKKWLVYLKQNKFNVDINQLTNG